MKVLTGIEKALAKLRHEHGLKQRELERRAGLSAATVSRYETGMVVPSTETIDKVLFGLGVSLHELANALDAVNGREEKNNSAPSAAVQVRVTRQDRMLELALEKIDALERELFGGEKSEKVGNGGTSKR